MMPLFALRSTTCLDANNTPTAAEQRQPDALGKRAGVRTNDMPIGDVQELRGSALALRQYHSYSPHLWWMLER